VALGLAELGAEWFKRSGSIPWPADVSKVGEHLACEARLAKDAALLCYFALESTVRYLHSSGDLLAQLVRTRFQLCENERRCGTANMVDRNRGCTVCAVARPEYAPLLRVLGEYSHSPQYRYCVDATNRIKHRTMLPKEVSASLEWSTGDIHVGQCLSGFSHDGRRYSRTSLPTLVARTRRLRNLARPVVQALSGVIVVDRGATPPHSWPPVAQHLDTG
jgi:hypothetical protein